MSSTQARGAAAACGRIYVFGGHSNGQVGKTVRFMQISLSLAFWIENEDIMTIECFDPDTQDWEVRALKPCERYAAGGGPYAWSST